jgi:hypothetical protein
MLFMFLGVLRLKRAAVVLVVLGLTGVSLVSCGYSSSYYKPPSGLNTRVLISESVSSPTTSGGLIIVNAEKDTFGKTFEIGAGSSPGLMAISPTRGTLLAFDSSSTSVQVINTVQESTTGRITLPGPTTSMVAIGAGTASTGYAAVPTAANNLWTVPGAVEVMNLSTGTIPTAIGAPGAQTVVSNLNGTQLLVFGSDPNSVSIISPILAVPPIDQGCDTAPNPVCTVVTGFDHPVNGFFGSDGTAYILNCGPECGGTQASVQILDLSTTPPSPGAFVPVDGGVTFALPPASGSTLYVAGNSPSDSACTGQTTAATTCGRLSVIDLASMTVTSTAVITDGYHDHLDMSNNGQLFIGSHGCTTIGDVNNPSGEVRGCLSIFNTSDGSVVVPPDNGDVTGLQSFTSRSVEYVIQGNTLRIYDTTKDVLQPLQLTLSGLMVDVKAIDFF